MGAFLINVHRHKTQTTNKRIRNSRTQNTSISLYRRSIFLTKVTLKDSRRRLSMENWPNPASLNQEKTSSGLVLNLTNCQHFKNSFLLTLADVRAVVTLYLYLPRWYFTTLYHLDLSHAGTITHVSWMTNKHATYAISDVVCNCGYGC